MICTFFQQSTDLEGYGSAFTDLVITLTFTGMLHLCLL